jgi:hypothetical protein
MLAAALSFLLLAAQAQPDRNCTDDRNRDRCGESSQQEMRALYGVQSIEELAASRTEVRRIFYVDGYGNDLVLIAFVRAPGRDPELQVHHPRREGRPTAEPFRVPVTQAAWNEVAERGSTFERRFAPIPGRSDMICLHSWVFTIEAAEPSRFAARPFGIRRKVEDACNSGPGQAYAQEVQRIALPLVPHCAALDPDQHRNAASILSFCRLLKGDRLAAAEVANGAMAFRSLGGSADSGRIAGRFAEETAIDWAGEQYRGPGHRAGEFWASRSAPSAGTVTNMSFERIEGETGARVRVVGRLSRSLGDANETAAVEQIWVRDINGAMRIERATVGPWQRRR